MTENERKLLLARYCLRGEKPEVVYERVARALSLGDRVFENDLLHAMNHKLFFPNSPAIRNAGQRKGMLHACFALPIQDSICSIFDTVSDMAKIFQRGGGVGINFSRLRPTGAPLSSGGVSSGGVSFMGIFNQVTETVKQGGYRRGALMGILNHDHPEILEFARAKLKGDLTNFNISVMVSDEFMEKAEAGGKVPLVHGGKKYASIKARDILDLICFSAWCCGDPGLLFLDRINADNPYRDRFIIDTTNPCLTGDTVVESVLGKYKIQDLALMGVDVPVYTYNGERIDISWMRNIRKTGTQREVWKVKIDHLGRAADESVREIRATPNHQFMLRDGSYKQLQDLKPGDSLMPFYRYKRNSKGYNNLSLNDGTTIGEATLVAEWKYGRKIRSDECVHHVNGIKTDNRPANLEIKRFREHCSENVQGDNNPIRKLQKLGKFESFKQRNKGYNNMGSNNPMWGKKHTDETRRKISKTQAERLHNHRVVSVEFCGYEDVYDGEVEGTHNFVIGQGVVVHNCSEVALPHYGACCLGSINLSRLVSNQGSFDEEEWKRLITLGTRTLLNMNAIGWYPLPEITETMKEFNPIGLGVMGFADALIKMGVKYDSQGTLDFIELLGSAYREITNALAPSSLYRRIIAPTGSLSILGDCSSGIEPVFERETDRYLSGDIGKIEERRELYGSADCRTAHEISWDWHLRVQAKWQAVLDGGISKTINIENEISVEDIRKIYIEAWKSKVKGVTIFRDDCKEGVLRPSKCEGELCTL